MPKRSAGILLYRIQRNTIQVLLIHPGGPLWKNRDHGAWSIPKGEYDEREDALQAAIRETEEETGKKFSGDFKELSPVKIKSGKIIRAFILESDFDPNELRSNNFETEFPRGSGKIHSYPEADRAEWFNLDEAKDKINQGQIPFLLELKEKLGAKL